MPPIFLSFSMYVVSAEWLEEAIEEKIAREAVEPK